MKKVLVTGAGGYIGRHVISRLLEKPVQVIACDLVVDDIDPRADRRVIDIFSGDPNLFEACGSPDVCIHMAWKDGFIHQSDAHMLCLSGHYRFAVDMVRSGLSQLAVMGSMHEVGYFEGMVREDTPCLPLSQYGVAKNALRESLTLALAKEDVVFQWLRAFYIYGDDVKGSSIFAKLTQAVQNGQKTFPFTSGTNCYDFIHVDQLARDIVACALQQEESGIIHCCTGKPVALKDQVEAYIRDHGHDITLEYGAFPDRPYDSKAIWGDSEKIEAILRREEA